jgi:hypothetical protein
MSIRGLVLLATLAGTPLASASAQDRWTDDVRLKLGESLDELNDLFGVEPLSAPVFGSLGANQYATHGVVLDTQDLYAIIGACDSDCRDLDLELFDADGNLVDRDTGEDAYPAMLPEQPLSGVFSVRVTMVTCAIPPCRYGIQVLR